MITRIFCLCSFLGLFYFLAYCEQRATASDGKEVLLRDDGTWRFITMSDKIADKLKGQPPVQEKSEDAIGSGYSVKQQDTQTEDEPVRTSLVDVIKNDKSFDVRKARWGMTREDVKKSESLKMSSETKDAMDYKLSFMGLNAVITYKFTNNKLSGAAYVIQQDDVNPSRFYEDYKILKKFLRQSYNVPVTDDKNWTNDIYKAEEKNWGFAISLGFLVCETSWQSPTTKIILSQSGGNHVINTAITYSIREPKK